MINQLRIRFEDELETKMMVQAGQSEPGLTEMIRYHFGWHADGEQRGKRLRPVIHLLSTIALGAPLESAFNSAVALEIFHNFTLVHDDIQDKGDYRQGRLAMWKHYGIEQAINTGDFMAYAAFAILNQPSQYVDDEQRFKLNHAFTVAGLDVMRGQHLDMLYEKMEMVEISNYLEMIRYKTSRLFSLAFEMAGILNHATDQKIDKLRAIGMNIGMAFQIQDDYLGIWGDSQKTGKSTSTDILTKKKTFPLLLAINSMPSVRQKWEQNAPLDDASVKTITRWLTDEQINEKTLEEAKKYKQLALVDFSKVFVEKSQPKDELFALLDKMIA